MKTRKYNSSKPGFHMHHIIPFHMGGKDEIENLIELSIPDHAEAHRILFEKYGHWQDELAWKTLSGMITHANATKIAQQKADKSWMKTIEGRQILSKGLKKYFENHSVWNKGLTVKNSNHPGLLKNSTQSKKLMDEGKLYCISNYTKGLKLSSERCEQMRQMKLNAPKFRCQYCGKQAKAGMFKRWHGPKCKSFLS